MNAKKGLKVWIVKEIVGLVLTWLCLFIPAWSIGWVNGWLFFSVVVFSKVLGDWWLLRTQPGMLVQRATGKHEQTKPWDKLLAPLVAGGSLFISIVAGLDEHFAWLGFGFGWLIWVGLGFILLGSLLVFWAMASNPFFDATVSIQTERDHSVAMQGPYAFVRHPGYLGIFFLFLFMPLVLDSVWACIPALTSIIALILRTWLEDRTLKAELPGYAEYARKVKFRLFPNVW
ncbi:MAG: isoprenylcysteine carboxylmethyltransferase family protein [Anaerolineaceae bacterium]|nr:isoprenylcysteine carboxylmethyltransferase family protein [Anaerolineaceae bacterium]